MKFHIKTSAATMAVAMAFIASPASASQQIDSKSLTDVLVAKGVLTQADVKAVKHNDDGKLKLGAKFFLNTTRTDKTVETVAPLTSTKTKTVGLNVDRAYFTAKYYFNNDWMMRITTDANNEPTVKGNNIYLKYAYVEGKLLGKAAVLRLGQSHTPWIDYQQGQNKHRYVFKTFIDTWGFDTSSDLGIGLKGKVANGLVGYFVTATDGQGYGSGNTKTGNKAIDFDSRLSVYPMDDLSIDLQYRTGYRGTKTFVNNVTTSGIRSNLYQAQLAYTPHGFGIGAGWVGNTDSAKDTIGGSVKHGSTYALSTAAAGTSQLKSDGYYLWARGDLGSGFGTFGNLEYLKNKPQIATANDEKITRFVLGAEYSPVKNITFAAVVDHESFTNAASVLNNRTKQSKYGIYSQVKF